MNPSTATISKARSLCCSGVDNPALVPVDVLSAVVFVGKTLGRAELRSPLRGQRSVVETPLYAVEGDMEDRGRTTVMTLLGCCSCCCPHSTMMTILYLSPMWSQNRIQRESESYESLSETSGDHL